MADTMQYDVVSPERRLASGEATEVQIPGSEGDMTAMADHAATITTLRPGIVRVQATDGAKEFLVTGGFAEITATGTSVLAEHALPREEVTQEIISELMKAATEERDNAHADFKDEAVKRVADLTDVAGQLGLSA